MNDNFFRKLNSRTIIVIVLNFTFSNLNQGIYFGNFFKLGRNVDFLRSSDSRYGSSSGVNKWNIEVLGVSNNFYFIDRWGCEAFLNLIGEI